MKPIDGDPAAERSAIPAWAPGVLVAVSVLQAVLYSWRRHFTMDETFSMLQAIGQVPFGTDWATRREIMSQEVWVRNDLAGVLESISVDNGNMAGFVMALRGVIALFGAGWPLALAAVSIAGYVLTIYGTLRVGRRLFGGRVGLVAGALCLCHFGVLMFGLMLRGNGWAMAAGLFATEAYSKIIGLKQGGFDPREPAADPFRRHVAAYAGWSVVGLFAHFLCGLILAVHVLFALAAVRGWRTWGRLMTAGAIVILVVVSAWAYGLSSTGYGDVAAYVTWREHERGHWEGVAQRSPVEIVRALALAAQFMGGPYHDVIALIAFPASLAVFALAVPAWRRRFAAEGAPVVLTTMLASVAFVVAATRLMLADSLFPMRPRYMLVSIPYFLMLVALAFERFGAFDSGPLLKRPAKAIATAYAIIAVTVPLVVVYGSITIQKGDPHLVAAWQIADLARNDPAIRVSVPTLMDAQLMSFHLGPNQPVVFEIGDQAVTADVAASVRRIGIDHPVVVYFEFQDRYQELGSRFRRPVLAGAADGLVRYRNEPTPESAGR